ncbi:hypothetical protein V6N11_055612 [Hibiscus sabdariffa]|uniref:Uncharacterized protein n=1 Tax=Hibiscus sabdariffa TaxID=183260 RepID=A0ABR2NR33_9ROSI
MMRNESSNINKNNVSHSDSSSGTENLSSTGTSSSSESVDRCRQSKEEEAFNENDFGNDHNNHDMDNSSERDRHLGKGSSCVDKEFVKNSKEVDNRIGPSWAEIVSNKMCEGSFHSVENGLDSEDMDQMTNRKALELEKSLGIHIEGDESEAVREIALLDWN